MAAAPAAWFLSLVTLLSRDVPFFRALANCLFVSIKSCYCSRPAFPKLWVATHLWVAKRILMGRKKLRKSRNQLQLFNSLRLKLQIEVNVKPIMESCKKQGHPSRERYSV